MQQSSLINPRPTSRRRLQFTPPTTPVAVNNPMSFVVGRQTSRKRPIDKVMIVVAKPTVGTTQVSTTLLTATFPCTIVGLRWDLSVFVDGGTTPGIYGWAIVIVRQGITVSTISTGDGNTFFAPEQDVMAYGKGANQQIDIGTGRHYNGSTKSMRKMMGGDTLLFLAIGQDTQTSVFNGCIQFFCKT